MRLDCACLHMVRRLYAQDVLSTVRRYICRASLGQSRLSTMRSDDRCKPSPEPTDTYTIHPNHTRMRRGPYGLLRIKEGPQSAASPIQHPFWEVFNFCESHMSPVLGFRSQVWVSVSGVRAKNKLEADQKWSYRSFSFRAADFTGNELLHIYGSLGFLSH